MGITLTDDQTQAIGKLKTGSILVGDVGTGKTVTSLSYFAEKAPTRPILAITTAKKRNSGEWYEDALKVSLKPSLEVDSWNNMDKYTDRVGCSVIFDEQRVVGNGKWVKDFLRIAANNDWILLSATPAGHWMDLVPVFIANGFYRNRTDFCDQHVKWSRYTRYPKVAGYYDTDILEQYRSEVYVLMHVEKKTHRNNHFIDVDYDKEEERRIWQDRWDIYKDEPLLNGAAMVRALRESNNSHWSRFSAIKSLVRDHPRTIIFYNLNFELEILRGLGEIFDRPVREWNGHKHEEIPDTAEWVYLVQYSAGAEGWNCITTDTILFYSLPYTHRMLEQAKGRIDRMNTEFVELHYYILRSRSRIDQMIWKSIGKQTNFHVNAFIKSWEDEKPQEPDWLLRALAGT